MPIKKIYNLPGPKKYTHSLSIPIVTSTSRSQLHASFALFEQKTAGIIPKGSVLNPDSTMIHLGKFNLQSTERIDACRRHLHSIDMHQMLCLAAANAQPTLNDLPDQDHHRYSRGRDFSPLKVDLIGLVSPNRASRFRALHASAIDQTHRLHHFQSVILDSLSKAGFLAKGLPFRVKVVDTVMSSGWTRAPETGGRRRLPPLFDARAIIDKWKDYSWATSIQLEKVCVYPLSARDLDPDGEVREKQLLEIDSIALP